MRWQGRRKSSNVVNRRGSGGSSLAGGGANVGLILMVVKFLFSKFGIGGIVMLGVAYFGLNAVGINPLALVGLGSTNSAVSGQTADNGYDICEGTASEQQLCVVLASTEDVWTKEFAKRGFNYQLPELHVFSGRVTTSGCGSASSAVGPFYCPADQRVYLDTDFFNELAKRFGASGDFATAYVVAHEVGHHIQTLMSISSAVQTQKAKSSQVKGNELQVRMELQADCLAGVWAYHENNIMALEEGDINEALTAANAIGDDTLQRQAGQTPMPDSFTHGSSEQRVRWFKKGYLSGNMDVCDTFQAAVEL